MRDAADLAEKMEQMLLLSPEVRSEMGRRGREKVEREFDEQIVIGKYLEAIEVIFSNVSTVGLAVPASSDK